MRWIYFALMLFEEFKVIPLKFKREFPNTLVSGNSGNRFLYCLSTQNLITNRNKNKILGDKHVIVNWNIY
jgi:hypothetical protein